MRDSSTSECLIRLSSSLQSINKCIRDSRELLFAPTNLESSAVCHSSMRLTNKSPTNIELNINLSFSDILDKDTIKKVQEITQVHKEQGNQNIKSKIVEILNKNHLEQLHNYNN